MMTTGPSGLKSYVIAVLYSHCSPGERDVWTGDVIHDDDDRGGLTGGGGAAVRTGIAGVRVVNTEKLQCTG